MTIYSFPPHSAPPLLHDSCCTIPDAHQIRSIKTQQAKFARKKLISALAYMPPETIEAHTGMKVMTNDEFTTFMTKLETGRKEIADLHRKEGSLMTELNNLNYDTATMKADIVLLKEFLAKTTTNTTDAN